MAACPVQGGDWGRKNRSQNFSYVGERESVQSPGEVTAALPEELRYAEEQQKGRMGTAIHSDSHWLHFQSDGGCQEVRSEAVPENLLLQFNTCITNPSRNSLLLPCLGDSLQTHPGAGLKCQHIDNFPHLCLGSAP